MAEQVKAAKAGSTAIEELAEIKLKEHGKTTRDLCVLYAAGIEAGASDAPEARARREAARAMMDACVGQLQHALARIVSADSALGLRHVDTRFLDTFLAVTAWYRQLGAGTEEQRAADAWLSALCAAISPQVRESGIGQHVRWRAISGQEEAYYEYVAVLYAIEQSGLEEAHAILTGGSGSVQMVACDALHWLNAPLSKLSKVAEELSDDAGEATARIRQAISAQLERDRANVPAERAEGRTSGGYRAFAQMEGVLAKKVAMKQETRLVCISGFFYAAVTARLVSRSSKSYAYLPGGHVMAELVATIDALGRQLARPDALVDGRWKGFTKASLAKEIANLTRLHTLLSHLMPGIEERGALVKVLFARDWELQGNAYRTTWTTGWWLDNRRQAKPA